ncbi:MAG: hypothetical protein ABSF29_02545 [Tepidisphaeraceae bacterium]
MSQYPYPPNPYTPPPLNYSAWPMPPRRGPSTGVASILQLLLGGFLFLFGSCAGGAIWKLGFDSIYLQMQKQGAQIPVIPGHDVEAILRAFVIGTAVAMVLAGFILLALTPLVFRGGRGATLASSFLVGILAILMTLAIITGLAQLGPDPSLLFYLVGVIYCVATLVMQIQSLRTAADPRTAVAMQQAWYWLQQQQSASGYGYGQGTGYGYPPPPPAAPLPPPPPGSPNPPSPPLA